MKRIISLLFTVVFILALLCTTVSAEYNNTPLEYSNTYILDNNAETWRHRDFVLSDKIEAIRAKYSCDVSVYFQVPTHNTKKTYTFDTDITADAERIMERKEYGIGVNSDLLFLYCSVETGECTVVSNGLGKKACDGKILEELISKLNEFTKEGKYAEAVDHFATRADELLSAATGIEPVGNLTEEKNTFTNYPFYNSNFFPKEESYTFIQKMEGIRQKYNFDVSIITTNYFDGEDIDSHVEELYNKKGYGAGNGRDGIVLYVATDSRKYCIFVNGDYGTKVFNKNGHAYIEKQILPYLEKSDFKGAFEEFANCSEKLLDMAAKGEPFNELQLTTENLITIALAILIPLLIAFLMMRSKLSKMKTAVAQNYAQNYVKQGSFNLEESRDIFLYSHITKTKIQKNNGSSNHGGGSSRSRSGSF